MEQKSIYNLVIDRAVEIAKNDLNDCCKSPGIIAGKRHFDDFWARDSFFASWGFIATKDFEKAKSNLDFFIKFQRLDGLIPRRIDRFYLPRLKYLGIKILRKNLKPIYKGRFNNPNIDPNSVFVITAEKYFSASKDSEWLTRNIYSIKKALYWLKQQDIENDGLIDEGNLSNWMDTVSKFKNKGATLYSNILAWKALESGEKLHNIVGSQFPIELKEWKNLLKEKINQTFWNGEYFCDWFDDGKRFDYFTTDGNVLAIILGFTTDDQAKLIIRAIKKYFGNEYLPPPVNFPTYPKKYLALRHALSGLPGYHNGYGRWLWISCLSALAHKLSMASNDITLKQIGIVSDWIVKGEKVYEVYNSDGTPFDRPLWKSEAPFAWSAGIFLWTVSELNKFDENKLAAIPYGKIKVNL